MTVEETFITVGGPGVLVAWASFSFAVSFRRSPFRTYGVCDSPGAGGSNQSTAVIVKPKAVHQIVFGPPPKPQKTHTICREHSFDLNRQGSILDVSLSRPSIEEPSASSCKMAKLDAAKGLPIPKETVWKTSGLWKHVLAGLMKQNSRKESFLTFNPRKFSKQSAHKGWLIRPG